MAKCLITFLAASVLAVVVMVVLDRVTGSETAPRGTKVPA
jgi:hypothetical protein